MSNQKLVDALKPKELSDLLGFSNLVQGDGIFSKLVNNHYLFSFVLFGNPGIGKSSLVNILANYFSDYKKFYFNAAQDSKKDLNFLIDRTKENLKTIIVIDEIHSLHKNHQDFLLKMLESQNTYILATTTENPYIHLNPALRSRMQIFELTKNNKLILEDLYNKLSNFKLNNNYSKSDLEKLLIHTQYDIRCTLNLIDIIDNLYSFKEIDEKLIQKIGILSNYNSGKNTNELHDLKSAFQKSIRGSDVNASLYYLGCLIKFNDLKIIIRRMKIIAYEDIGLANPNLCMRVSIGCDAALSVGFPEANLILSTLVIEMALSPKSNSGAISINNVLEYLNANPIINIPNHLRDTHYSSSHNIVKEKYLYPHNFKNHFVNQEYLSKEIKNKFYNYDFSNENENKLNKNFLIWTRKD
ncbi:MAG: AAA family ATPase [Ureaplasma sp.]|nr:AAA family ATPase [Ureaplasma sp.]